LWEANSSNVARVAGRLLLNGAPVAGAHLSLDGYTMPQATAEDGRFHTDVDITIPGRRVVRPVALGRATVHGHALSAGQRVALLHASGGFSIGYGLQGLHATVQADGSVLLRGRLLGANRQAPPPVRLLTYRLGGTITDASGKPVQGAIVITRTQDRDFWTHSSASDANGHYTSFFAASDETTADPVILSVGVASGGTAYGGTLGTNVPFKRLRSAEMDVHLGAGTAYTVTVPSPQVGAIYSGLVVGVTVGGRVIKPVAERWPDAKGAFSMRLPASVRGKTVRFWENQRQFFSRFPATAGGAIDLAAWPSELGNAVPSGLAGLAIPRT
jgi:hypothetical protein